jgi:molecular chaperone DnaK
MATGKAQGIQISPAGGLSQAEIDRIIKEANSIAEADRQRRELSQVKNRLEGMLASNTRVFAEFLTEFALDERERIEETLKRSREIAASDSREALKEAIFDMQGVSKLLTRVMLQSSAGKGPASAVPPANGSASAIASSKGPAPASVPAKAATRPPNT